MCLPSSTANIIPKLWPIKTKSSGPGTLLVSFYGPLEERCRGWWQESRKDCSDYWRSVVGTVPRAFRTKSLEFDLGSDPRVPIGFRSLAYGHRVGSLCWPFAMKSLQRPWHGKAKNVCMVHLFSYERNDLSEFLWLKRHVSIQSQREGESLKVLLVYNAVAAHKRAKKILPEVETCFQKLLDRDIVSV